VPQVGSTGGPAAMIDSMRRFLRPAASCAAGILALAVLLALLVLNRAPAVDLVPVAQTDALSRTRSILRSSVPDTRRQTVRKTVALTTDDMATITQYAFARKGLMGGARFSIRGSRLRMQATAKLPWRWADLYLNIRLIADDAEPFPVVRQLKVGRLAVPHPLIGWLLEILLQSKSISRYRRIAADVVHEVRVVDGRLSVYFDWTRKALDQAGDWQTDVALRERLVIYQQCLVEVVSRPEIKKYVRLSTLMQPLFALAQTRSLVDHEPVEENRAVILLLNAYVNGRDVSPIGDVSSAEPLVPRRLALLNRRVDTAQHFVISAALVVSGTRTLADVAAMAKEINDIHSGSGFSFTDLAADSAGASFGKFAVHSPEAARNLQKRLSQSADESLFMPPIKDLPEHMRTDEFERRFGSIESAAFDAVRREIEARIAALAIYRF
jgi:hypothetical protein